MKTYTKSSLFLTISSIPVHIFSMTTTTCHVYNHDQWLLTTHPSSCVEFIRSPKADFQSSLHYSSLILYLIALINEYSHLLQFNSAIDMFNYYLTLKTLNAKVMNTFSCSNIAHIALEVLDLDCLMETFVNVKSRIEKLKRFWLRKNMSQVKVTGNENLHPVFYSRFKNQVTRFLQRFHLHLIWRQNYILCINNPPHTSIRKAICYQTLIKFVYSSVNSSLISYNGGGSC